MIPIQNVYYLLLYAWDALCWFSLIWNYAIVELAGKG